MHCPLLLPVLLLGLAAGCAAPASKPVESLDERTGVTVASLKEPIAMVPGAQDVSLAEGDRVSFAYLGPVEWDQAGAITSGLWVHIAPGDGRHFGDIHAPAALTLVLDDGSLTLSPMDAPQLGRPPYKTVASWGQVGYFELTSATLQRMTASRKLELDVRAPDGTLVGFFAVRDSRAELSRYLQARGTIGD